MPAILSKRKHAPKPQCSLDYPQQGERIAYPQYTLRVTAPESAQIVEVSIDDGPWMACRSSNGHWWFDWSGFENGEHEAVARFSGGGGKFFGGKAQEFFVEL